MFQNAMQPILQILFKNLHTTYNKIQQIKNVRTQANKNKELEGWYRVLNSIL